MDPRADPGCAGSTWVKNRLRLPATPDELHLLVGVMGADSVEVVDWRATFLFANEKTPRRDCALDPSRLVYRMARADDSHAFGTADSRGTIEATGIRDRWPVPMGRSHDYGCGFWRPQWRRLRPLCDSTAGRRARRYHRRLNS